MADALPVNTKTDGQLVALICMLSKLPDAGDPVVLLLLSGCRHAVHRVLALHHFALRVRLAGLDEVVASGGVQFEAVGFVAVLHLAHLNVLQRNDSARLLVRRVLEVVEAVVVEDEPAPLPRLVASALLPQPTLAIRIEERVHQVVAVVFRNLERLRFDAVVQALQRTTHSLVHRSNKFRPEFRPELRADYLEDVARKVLAVVDAAVHGDELFERRLLLDGRVVQTRVEHDDGERQHVARVRVGEDVGVELTVALRERLHHAVDLLRLARKPEAPEELAQRLHQDQIRKVVQVHERLEHLLVERRLFAQVIADGRLAQPLAPETFK